MTEGRGGATRGREDAKTGQRTHFHFSVWIVWHPNIDKSDQLQVFIADAVCSFPLEWNMTVDTLGLTAYRYKLPLSIYTSAFTNPENARWFSWCPDGLFYIGVSQWPVFGSKSHFLDGDPILREKVLGLHPNRSLHETVVDVEPITGVTVRKEAISDQFTSQPKQHV